MVHHTLQCDDDTGCGSTVFCLYKPCNSSIKWPISTNAGLSLEAQKGLKMERTSVHSGFRRLSSFGTSTIKKSTFDELPDAFSCGEVPYRVVFKQRNEQPVTKNLCRILFGRMGMLFNGRYRILRSMTSRPCTATMLILDRDRHESRGRGQKIA